MSSLKIECMSGEITAYASVDTHAEQEILGAGASRIYEMGRTQAVKGKELPMYPGFGSASLSNRRKTPGTARLTAMGGALRLRVLHEMNPDYNPWLDYESTPTYIAPNGTITDEPWSYATLGDGESMVLDVIEANAITAAAVGEE